MERIMKIAKGLDITLKVIWIINWVGLGAQALVEVVFLTSVNTIMDTIRSKGRVQFPFAEIDLSSLTVNLTPEQYRSVVLSWAITGLVLTGLSLIMIHLLRSIFRDMRQGRPFSDRTPIRIRRIAYVIFASALVSPLLQLIPAYTLERVLNLPELVQSSTTLSVTLMYKPNLMMIVIGFAVILLSFVFEYGARLQQESDETL